MPKETPGTDDLQSFLNNFHKEIEDGNVVTITPENAGEDKVVRKILLAANRTDRDGDTDAKAGSSADGDEIEEEDDVYYLDDEGNCYIKTTPQRQLDLRKKAKQAATAGGQSTSPGSSKVASERAKKTVVATPPNAEENEIEELADDPGTTGAEVYEFDDNSADGSAEAGADFVISGKQFKLKPVAVEPPAAATQKYGCPQCDYMTNKKFLISRHMRTHEEERAFKCSLCERGFKSNVGLVNHLNTHLGKRPHKCKHCESAFTTSGELIRHTRYKHTKEKPHKCTECSYASVELTKLRRHMTCHTGERPFQCPHCTYASQDMFKLKRHMVTHTGEKKYQCDICQSRFTQSNSLKSHKLIHSVVDKPIFQCTLCPTTCGRKADLRQHMTNMHSSAKPIPCKRCGQELPDRYQYKLHIKTHDGEKCYRCTLCSYASVSQRHLDSHMLIHTDQKPFNCYICGMVFRQRQLLKRHENLFHNADYKPPEPREKVHSCPTCSRTFTHKGNLMRHMESHDPTLNGKEDKLQLKLGRNLRLQLDGTVVTVLNETDFKELDKTNADSDGIDIEQYELLQDYNTEGQEHIVELEDEGQPVIKPVSKKKEQTAKKPVIINRQLRSFRAGKDLRSKPTGQGSTKTFRIKEEPTATEFTVEVQGEEQYMVLEVVNDGGVEVVDVKRELPINENNCFGFEEDDDEVESYDDDFEQAAAIDVDVNGDGASQQFLELMDIIEQDN